MKIKYIKFFIIFACIQAQIAITADQAINQTTFYNYNKKLLQSLRSTMPDEALVSYIQDLLRLKTTRGNFVVNLNLQDFQKNTPIILALKNNHPLAALLILEQKNSQGQPIINLEHKNMFGETALDYAITKKNIRVTKKLIELGAQIQPYNLLQIENIQKVSIKKAFIKILITYKNPFKKRSSKNNKKGSIFFKTLLRAYDEYQQLGHSNLLFCLLQIKEYQAYFKPKYLDLILFDLQTTDPDLLNRVVTNHTSANIIANVDQNINDATQLLNRI